MSSAATTARFRCTEMRSHSTHRHVIVVSSPAARRRAR